MKLDRVIAVRNTRTVYRDGNKCIKVFNKSHPKSDVLNEALNLTRIEEAGIRGPKLAEVTTVDGKWALVYDYIKGDTLAYLLEKHPENKDEYLERFVDIQLSVQSHTCSVLPLLKDRLRLSVEQAELGDTARKEILTRLAEMPNHKKVCHGDFNPSNIIITDGNEPYILDWPDVTQGDASADAARTYLLFLLCGDTDGAEKYLDLFCKKSDTARQYVRKWMPIVAASQSVKANEKERKFLLGFVNAEDHEQE